MQEALEVQDRQKVVREVSQCDGDREIETALLHHNGSGENRKWVGTGGAKGRKLEQLRVENYKANITWYFANVVNF